MFVAPLLEECLWRPSSNEEGNAFFHSPPFQGGVARSAGVVREPLFPSSLRKGAAAGGGVVRFGSVIDPRKPNTTPALRATPPRR